MPEDRPWFEDDPCPVCGGKLMFHEEDKEELDGQTVYYGYVYCQDGDCGYDSFASY